VGLILVRHTTPDVAKGICFGRTDLALAASFEVEAQAVAARLSGMGRDLPILSSPLTRCRRLAAHLGPHEVHAAFTEMDFGRWEGVSWEAIPRAELDAWAGDFMGARPHGGESVAQLRDRVAAGLESLPQDCVIVTHAGVIKAVAAILGHPEGWEIRPAFGEVLVFQ
jgi:alpha-ribazole phosphatase